MLQKQKSLLTKCLAFLFIICCSVVMVLGMVACSKDDVKTITSIEEKNGTITITMSDGKTYTISNGKDGAAGKDGVNGENGKDGVGVKDVKVVDGKLVITLTDGTSSSFDMPKGAAADCKHENTNDVPVKEILKIENGKVVYKCEYTVIKVCKDCGHATVGTEDKHDWEDNVALKRESCMVPASLATVCKNCGEIKEGTRVFQTIEGKTGFEWDGTKYDEHQDLQTYTVKINLDEPTDTTHTCLLTTKKVVKCEKCGITVSSEVIEEAKGHELGAWTVVAGNEPTDTAKGKVTRTCVRNDLVETQEIPALKTEDGKLNSYYTETKNGPKCNKDTKLVYTFTYDGQEVSFTKALPVASGVHYVNGNTINVGGRYYIDDVKYNGALKVVGGNSKLNCKNYTEGIFQCEECNEYYDIFVIAHHEAYVKGVNKLVEDKCVDATCSAKGKIVYICNACGLEAEEEIAQLAHDWTTDKAPEEKDGKWSFELKCNNCTATKKVDATKAPKVTEEAADCTHAASTAYTDIYVEVDGNEVLLKDDEGNALVVRIYKGEALGHRHETLGKLDSANEPYDLRDPKYSGMFKIIASSTKLSTAVENCKNIPEEQKARAIYTCVGCGDVFEVGVYYSHSGEGKWKGDKAPTCNSGAIKIINCDDCGLKDYEVGYPALPHNYVYTIPATGSVFKGKCTNDGCSAIESIVAKTDESGSPIYTVSTKATCSEYGKVVVTKEDGSQVQIVTDKIAHTLNGKVIVIDATKPYNYAEAKALGIIIKGGDAALTCRALTAPNALFVCDMCENYYDTYVIGSHTVPEGTPELAPTCEKGDSRKYHCPVCDTDIPETEGALGHDVTWTVSEDHTKIIVSACGREGCEFEGKEISLKLPSFDLDNDNKELITGNDSGFEIETVVKVTCAAPGTYTLTLKGDKLADVLGGFIYKDGDVLTITHTVSVGHKYGEGAKIITWVEGNKKYTGRRCTLCNQVIAISVENI